MGLHHGLVGAPGGNLQTGLIIVSLDLGQEVLVGADLVLDEERQQTADRDGNGYRDAQVDANGRGHGVKPEDLATLLLQFLEPDVADHEHEAQDHANQHHAQVRHLPTREPGQERLDNGGHEHGLRCGHGVRMFGSGIAKTVRLIQGRKQNGQDQGRNDRAKDHGPLLTLRTSLEQETGLQVLRHSAGRTRGTAHHSGDHEQDDLGLRYVCGQKRPERQEHQTGEEQAGDGHARNRVGSGTELSHSVTGDQREESAGDHDSHRGAQTQYQRTREL
ncbi:MAG: hypothetical protein US42_C0006G0051 [Candidatus Magasanikbacteria bacterium GW2011_GWC2_37_14]|uniref:Uncharacterized protein n=1 Tax=Candidatus Magasanikbacteria bacterium GW2011_GWC2_37_14 TaxID=1619046 RepID=A0A0G0IUB3_9BACT|nr:MAG: hypothetical protein US42_C0006G0051 [Candidatus Magasanikbacteria bacterium GW2011_GWC2_37_14]